MSLKNAFPPLTRKSRPHFSTTGDHDGVMPSKADLRRAATSLRKIITETENLPDDGPKDGGLRDRLELAANVMNATAGSHSVTIWE